MELNLDRCGNLCIRVIISSSSRPGEMIHQRELVKITKLSTAAIHQLLCDLDDLSDGYIEASLPDGSSLGRKSICWWRKVLNEELDYRSLNPKEATQ